MSDKQETFAEIIAEWRECLDATDPAETKRKEADRLEAALKRDTLQLRREIEHLKDERNKAPVRERERLRKNGFVIEPQERLLTKPADNVNSGAASDSRDNSGDAAKLREALAPFPSLCDWLVVNASKLGIPDMVAKLRKRGDKARAALAAPPRNCDRFASVDEARKAHEAICEKYGKCHHGCPLNNEEHYSAFDCFEAWLFAPATAKEGGAE